MKKILLVEDDKFLNDLYADALTQSGYEVNRVADAQVALDKLDEQGTDLIVLDIYLPVNNAFEIMQQLQSYSDWQKVPIILISSRQMSESQLPPSVMKQMSISKYLYKPDTLPKDLVAAVKESI